MLGRACHVQAPTGLKCRLRAGLLLLVSYSTRCRSGRRRGRRRRAFGFKDVFLFQLPGLFLAEDDELLIRRADDEFFYPLLAEGVADLHGVFVGPLGNGKVCPVMEQRIELEP